MKNLPKILLGIALLLAETSIADDHSLKHATFFQENKGQLKDQNNNPRPDIQYYGSSDDLNYFFKSTGISYQLYEPLEENKVSVSRIDMTWLGANPQARLTSNNAITGVDNFYNTGQHTEVLGVRSYGDLQYHNIYPGIDLHYYFKNGSLKYDFIVAPGADHKRIRIQVDGAKLIRSGKDGTIAVVTENGILTEAMPVAFQGNKEIKAAWTLEGDVLSFELSDYNSALPLVIDPLVYKWKKNEGDPSGLQQVIINYYRSVCDAYGNTYVAANKQGTAPGSTATYLNKYSNALGATTWSKSQYTPAAGLNVSIEGLALYGNDLYMCGRVLNVSTFATTGAYQTTISGNSDAFLIKSDSSGTKIWGTYYGGTSDDVMMSCNVDSAGYLFVCGATNSSSNIASPAAQQTTSAGLGDAFAGKFNTSNGYGVWSTYFGGSAADSAKSLEVRGNRLYIAGTTKSSSGIATAGAHQTAYSGNINGFLLCMDTSGITQWSTYYGADSTIAEKCILTNEAIYLSGTTNASTGIGTTGTFQPAIGGATDGFLAKFNFLGVRQWGTYYGGSDRDIVHATAAANPGRIYIGGNTKSTTGIATPNAYNASFVSPGYTMYGQPVGVAFAGEIDVDGQRVSGTYFNAGTMVEHISANSSNTLFLSGTVIMDMNDYASFFTRFDYCNASTPTVTAASNNICANSSVLLSSPVVSGASYQWYRNDVLISGATSNTYSATLAGTYKLIIDQCPNGVSDNVVLTTSPVPVTSIAKTDAPCAVATNGSITVTPSGATAPYSFVWDNSTNTSATLSGLTPGSYVVHTSDANTCVKTDTVTITNTNDGPVSTAAHTNVPCYGDPLATITVTTAGGAAPYSYTWDNLPDTTSYLVELGTGTYIVHTIDANNCSDADTILIDQNTTTTPSDPLASICAVTVDSASGKNIILWQKNGLVNATSYNIYRETEVAGQYALLGNKLVGESSFLIDNSSVPLQQSYSYKISEIDSCDHELPLSDLHRTIHLSANVGVNGENNLSWNTYQGKPYTTHSIYRSFNGAAFTLLNEVSGTITAYSDLTPPLGNNVYRIQIDLGAACDTAIGGNQHVVSNKVSLGTTSINDITAKDQTQILPNPTAGNLRIIGSSPDMIHIYDAMGRLMMEKSKVSNLNITGFAKGMYLIRLYDKSGALYHSGKIVLQ
jgi:hypothetical protein